MTSRGAGTRLAAPSNGNTKPEDDGQGRPPPTPGTSRPWETAGKGRPQRPKAVSGRRPRRPRGARFRQQESRRGSATWEEEARADGAAWTDALKTRHRGDRHTSPRRGRRAAKPRPRRGLASPVASRGHARHVPGTRTAFRGQPDLHDRSVLQSSARQSDKATGRGRGGGARRGPSRGACARGCGERSRAGPTPTRFRAGAERPFPARAGATPAARRETQRARAGDADAGPRRRPRGNRLHRRERRFWMTEASVREEGKTGRTRASHSTEHVGRKGRSRKEKDKPPEVASHLRRYGYSKRE